MNATQILEMPAADLVGRIVFNPNGAEFVVTGLTFDARTGQVVMQIDEVDNCTGAAAGAPCGVFSLKGWTVANRL
ncbi:hypothetical protein ACT8ZV_12205 [Nocardioides sp. MAHUQ-72]|uniref:hypothetical protein n=1 Tax=unclassified Nocardioides TaxID=2615069 RepID=UPI00360D63AF